MTPTIVFTPVDEAGADIESEADLFPEDDAPATPAETRNVFLDRARSGFTKVRHSFVQVAGKPSTLAALSRNQRAAILYLALLTNRPWLSRQEEPLPADAWIRFLTCDRRTLDNNAPLTWTPQSVSHAWGVLEQLDLIRRPRRGRLLNIQPLREDGTAAPYTSPTGANKDAYLALPHEFWTEQYHGILSWPALAVLLILLKETGGTSSAPLAIDRAQRWYGISRTTAEQGLVELRNLGVLMSTERQVKDEDSTGGRRRTSLHALRAPFSTKHRESLRRAAQRRVASRSPREVDHDEREQPQEEPAAT